MKRRDVPIRSRCDQVWGELRGIGPVRHCDVCDAPVTNLSLLSKPAAKRVLARGPQCLAYRCRPDGTIVFADLVRRSPPRVASAGVALLLAACGTDATTHEASGSDVVIETREPARPEQTERDTERQLRSDSDAVEACRRLTGAAQREQNRREMAEESARAPQLDCELMRQLSALGGYGLEIPDECLEEE